jgi:hypothetical protein
MTVKRVYVAISAITAELARKGVPKSRFHPQDEYAYRGIDDICNRLSPLLGEHRLCILPRVLNRHCEERQGSDGSTLLNVNVKVAFDIVSTRDGSSHTVETYGEGLDSGDNATSKAVTSAYKQALLQSFCIPVQGTDDTVATSSRLKTAGEEPDPDQGWEQWGADVQDMVRVCESREALDRVQTTYRAQLRAVSKRQPQIFNAIGEAMQRQRRSLKATPPARPVSRAAISVPALTDA